MAQTEILIRPLEPSDWEAMTDILSQPNVIRNTVQMPLVSRAEYQERFGKTFPRMTRLGAAIDRRLVGVATLLALDGRRSHVGELGMSVHDDFQGRGVGTALFSALIHHADNWLGLKRLKLSVLADNVRAVAIYERLGFVREGIQRAHVFREGAYIDTIEMARVRGV